MNNPRSLDRGLFDIKKGALAPVEITNKKF